MGMAAAFSFYPGKNLGACGEGGAVTTSNELIANRIRMIRDHGQAKKYYHDMEGYNGRIDAIQAGLLKVKLKRLPEWNQKRIGNALLYTNLFSPEFWPGNIVAPPYVPEWARPVYHLYIARVPRREKLQGYLHEKGIGTGLHYPVPVHLQKAYSGKGYKRGDFPITERVSSEILSLPMFPELTTEQIEYVVKSMRDYYSKQS
jgi:dTDP-4-amino-4,6-dideoxygalactose transaminase